ncbi:Cytochrome b/b6 domain-containing protein [mine drainage metagenome]|uniref:Cytochrome b/b6 domain-containing protein n=1 Tax=mine drainage metagenome TaxID=410659 RepID=T1A523_9ZZZZ
MQSGPKPADESVAEDRTTPSMLSELKSLAEFFYIKDVPSYGNNFFFTIGVYLLELFGILAITGIVMLVFGPYWWNLTTVGTFFRSLHLWAAEAFVTLIFIHMFVQFATSSFKKKQLVWMIGSVMLFLVFLEFAFGVGVQGGFVAQWNAKAGADLWNGMGLGYWVNPLNMTAVLGWHVAIVPILLVLLMFVHYMLVKQKGLSKPYRSDIPYSIVPANHKIMYRRMAYIFIIVLLFAVFLRSPYIAPLSIQQIANTTPGIAAITFIQEFNYSSATATYVDTIDPYTFSTRTAFVTVPYQNYMELTGSKNYEAELLNESPGEQNATLSLAAAYFNANGSISSGMGSANPAIALFSQLTHMAQTGTYQDVLQNEVQNPLNETYVIRFITDSGALDTYASQYGLRTSQWGMLKAGNLWWQIGSYWTAPYNWMEIVTSGIPWWGDIENGTIAVVAFAVLVFLPFIPGVRQIPDKLKLYKIFWNRYTIPEMKKAKIKPKK